MRISIDFFMWIFWIIINNIFNNNINTKNQTQTVSNEIKIKKTKKKQKKNFEIWILILTFLRSMKNDEININIYMYNK
jgi:hypothetical protein